MRIKLAAAAMAFVMAFSACSTETTTTPASPESSQSATPENVDELFVDVIRDNTDSFDTASDEQMLDTADAICDLWDTGATFEDQAQAVLSAGVDVYDGGFFIGAATQAYCPEYSDEIEKGFDGGGTNA